MPFAIDAAVVLPGLLAAGLIDAIGPLLVVAFWVIRQVLIGLKEQRESERARQEAIERGEPWRQGDDEVAEEAVLAEPAAAGRAERVERAEAAAPAQQAGQADLRSEVEEFLRRAANPGAPPAPRPAEKRPLDPFDDRPTRPRKPPRPQRSEQASVPQQAGKAPPKIEPTPAPRGSLRHLPESQLAENAAHLGESIATADDRVEARLHDKFDHRLGSYAARPVTSTSSPSAPVAEPASAAARIRGMLSKPGGARDAMILSEILRFPSDRI
jgi:FtsZ-interacting cell division protein ZipA